MRNVLHGIAVLLGAVFLALAVTDLTAPARAADLVREPAPPSGLSWPCSGFSDERTTAGGIGWSYRVCGAGGPWSELDFRFRNEGTRAVVIGFRAWLERPRNCDTAGGPESGRAALAAGETSPWADHLYRVRTTDFDGRVWLCVREIEAAS